MVKKLIISLFIIGLIVFGVKLYNSQKTIECWWSVMYPSLSYVEVDSKSNEKSKISSTNPYYIYALEEPIKVKIAIVEWFKKYFQKGDFYE